MATVANANKDPLDPTLNKPDVRLDFPKLPGVPIHAAITMAICSALDEAGVRIGVTVHDHGSHYEVIVEQT